MRRRRVLITGVGVVSPLAVTHEGFCSCLSSGGTAVKPVTGFDPARFRCRRAAEVDDVAFAASYTPLTHEIKRMGRFVRFALAAARDALRSADLDPENEPTPRGAVYLGVAMGGLPEIEAGVLRQESKGPRGTTPYLIPSLIPNMAASQIALQHGITGPQYTLAGACASGGQALGLAADAIRRGSIEWAIAGGAEAVVTPIAFSGFEAMRALSTDEGPAPRPFDARADGLIIGEGAAIFVLESEAHAARRSRRPLAEVAGAATSGEGESMTTPSAAAAARCVLAALNDAGLGPAAIDCVFGQATGLRTGDERELRALSNVFAGVAPGPVITSIEGHIGHTFGASGPLAAAAAIGAIGSGRVPPTRHFEGASPEFEHLDIAREPRLRDVRHCLVDSFGFGGINACVVVSHAA